MKQFIVLAATLPLLLVFIMQFSADQQYRLSVVAVDDAVYAAKEMARQEGCFTPEIIDWLKQEISKKVKSVEPAEVVIGKGTDTEPVYRITAAGGTGLIHYQISVPMKNTMAGRSLLHASGEPVRWYIIDAYTPSELLPD